MARARTLVPGFFTDEKIVSVSFAARLLFQGIWTEADREGRLEDKPVVLKMRLFPVDHVDVPGLLGELIGAGLINRYEVSGRRYLLVPKFKEHQHVHPKEAPSKLPVPPLTDEARENASCMSPENNPSTGTREKASCMTVEPGKEPHGEGVNQSAIQAFRPSGPSGLQALVPSAGLTQPAMPEPVDEPSEDKNTWDREAEAFVAWAKGLDTRLGDPGPKVVDWARNFFAKYQPADQERPRAAFARFLLWCHQAGLSPGWGLWLEPKVWEPRWDEVRAGPMARKLDRVRVVGSSAGGAA